MKTPTRILLGDDGSRISSAARQAAMDLARKWNANLHVMLVEGPGDGLGPEISPDLVARCAAEDLACAIHEVTGDPARELRTASVALHAELVVLGSHGRGDGMIPGGSVGRAVINAATTPVLIVREGTWPPARIVVGDDGSSEARAAMDLAADIGSAFEARAFLVDALPELREPGHDPMMMAMAKHIADEEAERLSEDSAAMRERLRGPATGLLSHDTPAIAIRQSVADAGPGGHVLVAVGSSGRTEFERQLGWSVSARAVNIEGASVLVVPRAWALQHERTGQT